MPDRCPAPFARIFIGLALLLPLATQAQPESWYQVELLVFSYPAGGTAEQWDPTPDLAYPQSTRFLATPGKQSAQALPTSASGTAPLTPFTTLPATQHEFASQADAMQRNGSYRLLYHEAWMQPMTSQSGALPIVLDHSGDGGQWPQLQGTITLYQSSDLYVETNLWMNTQGEYLHSSWRMPPPPLGPPSSVTEMAKSETEVPQDSAAGGEVGAYPYRHAVLLQQTRRMRSGEVSYIDHPMFGVLVKITALSGVESEATAPPASTALPGTTVSPKPGPEVVPSP